jgi:predicted MPP superfamily phosphohydrolase
MRLTRRQFFKRAAIAVPAALAASVAHATCLEPAWLKLKTIRIPSTSPTPKTPLKIAHFTDLHFRGDTAYLQRVVQLINAQKPDLVCFTGDVVEEAHYFAPALEILKTIQAPLYGIPGNHDFWARADFKLAREIFSAQGGRWLMDESIDLPGTNLKLHGVTGGKQPAWQLHPTGTNILLSHYPNWTEKISNARFDLILSGHSHGGQVRLPFIGALLVPSGVGQFELGLFQTPAGPMYVNPGIGYFYANVRFNCRPELTIFEI